MKLPRLPIPAVVILGFTVVVGAALLVGYVLEDVPTANAMRVRVGAKKLTS